MFLIFLSFLVIEMQLSGMTTKRLLNPNPTEQSTYPEKSLLDSDEDNSTRFHFDFKKIVYQKIVPIVLLTGTILNSPLAAFLAMSQTVPTNLAPTEKTESKTSIIDVELPNYRDQLLQIVGEDVSDLKLSDVMKALQDNTDIRLTEVDKDTAYKYLWAEIMNLAFYNFSNTDSDKELTLTGLSGASGMGGGFIPQGESTTTLHSYGIDGNLDLIPKTIANIIGIDVAKLNIESTSLRQAVAASQVYFQLNLASNNKAILEWGTLTPTYLLQELKSMPRTGKNVGLRGIAEDQIIEFKTKIDNSYAASINAKADYYAITGQFPNGSDPYNNPELTANAIDDEKLNQIFKRHALPETEKSNGSLEYTDIESIISNTNRIIQIIYEYGGVPEFIRDATDDLRDNNVNIGLALKNKSKSDALFVAALLGTYTPSFRQSWTSTNSDNEFFGSETNSSDFQIRFNIIGGRTLSPSIANDQARKSGINLEATERNMYSRMIKAYNLADQEMRLVVNEATRFIKSYERLLELKAQYDAGNLSDAEKLDLIEAMLNQNKLTTEARLQLNLAIWKFFLTQNGLSALLSKNFAQYVAKIALFEAAIARMIEEITRQ